MPQFSILGEFWNFNVHCGWWKHAAENGKCQSEATEATERFHDDDVFVL